MAARIRSLRTSCPILVPLRSGATVRLSAGQVSAELPDAELIDNPKIDKLCRSGDIEVQRTGESVAAGQPTPAGTQQDEGAGARHQVPSARPHTRAESAS